MSLNKSGGGQERKLSDKSNGIQAGSIAIGIACDGTITSDTLEQNLLNDAGSNTAGIFAPDVIVRKETNVLENQGGPPNLAPYDHPQTERPGSSRSSPTRANQRGSTADNLRAFGETPPGTLVGTISRTHIVNGDQVNSATNTGSGRVVNHVNQIMKVGGNQINQLRSSGHPKEPIESTEAAISKMGNRIRNANKLVGLEAAGNVDCQKISIKIENKTVSNSHSCSEKSQATRKPPPPFVFNMPNPSRHFKGREDTLKAVRSFFDNVAVDTTDALDRTVVIAGAGGMGKTETAYKFAAEVNDIFPNIAWIDAETQKSLMKSFRGLASKLGVVLFPSKDVDLVKEVYHHIDQQDYGKVLFIFDNASRFNTSGDDFGIYDYLPTWRLENKRYPHIVVTTQTHEWGKQIKVLRVKELSFDDSMEFFSSAFRVSTAECNEQFKRLHKITEGYPLVMNLAASNIDDNRNDSSIRELHQQIDRYIQEFEEENGKILTEEMKHWPTKYKKTLLATWQMTFKRLEQEPNGPEALHVLQIMSFLNLPICSSNIQSIWLWNTTDSTNCLSLKENSLRLKKSYYLLQRFYAARILQVEKDDGYEFKCVLGIHRLVQLAVREQTNCSQALEHILCYKTISYKDVLFWTWEVNSSALHATLLRTTKMTPRALTFLGILACYSNPVARKIVKTKTPETEAVATFWPLYRLQRGMTSLSENSIQVFRELVELAKSAKLITDKLVYVTFTWDLLNNEERGDGFKPGYFFINSFKGIETLMDELVMIDVGCLCCKHCDVLDYLRDLKETRLKLLLNIKKTFARVRSPLPRVVDVHLAQTLIPLGLPDDVRDGVIETFCSPDSSQSRIGTVERRRRLWNLGLAKQLIQAIKLRQPFFWFYSMMLTECIDVCLDGMNLMDKRVQEVILSFTEMATIVDAEWSDVSYDNNRISKTRFRFLCDVFPVRINSMMKDSSREYRLKYLSRSGTLVWLEGSLEDNFRSSTGSVNSIFLFHKTKETDGQVSEKLLQVMKMGTVSW